MINNSRLLETFMELARTDSISFEERKCANLVSDRLHKLGLNYYEDDTKSRIQGDSGNIVCQIQGSHGIPTILLMSHLDTVTPGIGKEPRIDGEYIRTNGRTILGADDHAGVAVMLEIIQVLTENQLTHGDIYAIFTVAEEKGLLGSKNLDFSKNQAKYGFVLDDGGPIGKVTVQAPFQNNIHVRFKGKAAHAGVEPEKGINAIVTASAAISKMKLGRIDSQTTANVGIISGGNATNIVCDHVDVNGEVRSQDEESLEKQTKQMRTSVEKAVQKHGGTFEFTSSRMYSGYQILPENPILQIVSQACNQTGVEMILACSGGGSDTNILNQVGIPCVNLSVGMENVHTVQEQLKIEDLYLAAKLMLNIILSVA